MDKPEVEYFNSFEGDDGDFRIAEFPDSAKIIQLDGHLAKQIADYTLHKSDLRFAMKCLKEINDSLSKPHLAEALWRGAITHYIKCYGTNKARSYNLNYKNIHDDEGQTWHNFFKSLRDKHVIHDENAFSKCLPGAVLNKQDSAYKIEKIIATHFRTETLEQAHYNNLHLLIERTENWVSEKFLALCDQVTKELENKTYEELINYPSLKSYVAKWEEIDQARD